MKKTTKALLVLFLAWFWGCSSDSTDTDASNASGTVDKTANLQGTGDSARDLLSNENFTKLKIEIAYVDGYAPTEEAIDGFVNYLKERTFKEEIEIVYNTLPSPDEESLTLDEIADLESKNRTVYNEGSTLAIYIYFADAPADGDDLEEGLVTLGAVYRNTSMIIHEATVRKLAAQSFFISDADVENTTLNHEFGHLFGLVNLGTPSIHNHEDTEANDGDDPAGNNHCSVAGCLMRAELQFGGGLNKGQSLFSKNSNGLIAPCRLSGASVIKMLENRTAKGVLPTPPDLDAECLLDLASNGGR
ncbi:hypothetical protein [Pseudozobellia thermophila]|uniref:Membrane metalloprotease n=1 Tax=Pseudozobellia thermophila TaxID=192903 RepID=A0A1M6MA16_9FLAO|nr:hypothetical protein [Pseudozobellia thermophila]SHJ80292.1 hypothetical protein SAMN04488513_10960 [Pseudozobellia thermophila]